MKPARHVLAIEALAGTAQGARDPLQWVPRRGLPVRVAQSGSCCDFTLGTRRT